MKAKALTGLCQIEHEIDMFMDNGYRSEFDMYKYLVRELQYSSRVVKYMQDSQQSQIDELKNEEDCPQLKEAYAFLTLKQRKSYIKFLERIESDIVKYCNNYKPVRKKKNYTAQELTKKLSYLKEWDELQLVSIDPQEIIRARQLWTYNPTSNKLCVYRAAGLSVKGSTLWHVESSEEKKLGSKTKTILQRLINGGKIVCDRLMEEINAKSFEPSPRLNRNTLLIKVIK
jgi:hypothetical protein